MIAVCCGTTCELNHFPAASLHRDSWYACFMKLHFVLATVTAFFCMVPIASSIAAGPCELLETRAPNAPDQKPDFPGQTRACGVRSGVQFQVTVLAKGLEHPWSV